MDVLFKRFVRANRIPVVHSPLIPPLPKLGRRESGEALNAFERTENSSVWFWEMPLAKAAILLLLAALTVSAQAGVREMGAIGLTVGDLDRELVFYTNTLPDFTPLQGGVPIIHDGQVIGAIGCSGAKSAQQDEEVAKTGAAAFESKQNK